ncbi:MAG: 60S ribosomal protein L31, partial [Nanoarchaeota archaeon]|nr:60S ribosomal protein L31 [Nanoarchaeota archaeon]
PLRRGYANTPRYKRTNKAVRVLKKFLVKHMKSEKLKIGPHLNELLWENGIKNPPSRVTVVATKDAEQVVRVEVEGKEYVDFKQYEKKEAPKNLQDKIKKTVEEAKGTSKKEAEKPAATEKKEEKATTTEKPAKAEEKESPKAE